MADSTGHENGNTQAASPEPSTAFNPTTRTKNRPSIELPDELWITILESPCTFPREVFSDVMFNLVKNPNITSSHLFRADIFYDSETDPGVNDPNSSKGLLNHLKPECQPIQAELPGFDLQRTIVRQLIPRNQQLDRPLIQTCHFFERSDEGEDRVIVLYIPHVQRAEEIPFYHPSVARLAFEHRSRGWMGTHSDAALNTPSVSVSYSLFPSDSLTIKLERTALKLLETIHKHGQGQMAGYQKRVHHDQVIPQKRYQDTYARLKAKYGKQLSEQWVEVTDPGKHVFEDLGIAAFLIELWSDMYSINSNASNEEADESKRNFPGFVDIGCGNGVLVYILLAEGYEGWGFDARERKTWSIFPDYAQKRLQRRLLIPGAFSNHQELDNIWHNGILEPGTFIISNHADELTTWTPLLAYLNDSAFIAIPCCSHDLAGARFRAPQTTKAAKSGAARLPQQLDSERAKASNGDKASQAAETGSLKRTEAQKKMPSAYSTLCSYVDSLAEEVGFKPEHEVLRIPSTRNQCIIGRRKQESLTSNDGRELDERKEEVVSIVERELGKGIDAVGSDWLARAEKLAKKPGSGH